MNQFMTKCGEQVRFSAARIAKYQNILFMGKKFSFKQNGELLFYILF